MRRIAHISDLHFGRLAPDVLGPLRECVRRLEPHLVVVSGGLTAHAKPREFRDARAFLDTLPGPQVIVPGASDAAPRGFFNFSAPLSAYIGIVTGNLEPEYADDAVAVIGVDTSRAPGVGDGGDIDAQRARGRIHGLDARAVKVIATHRPLFDTGADIVLTGYHRELAERESTTPVVIASGMAPLGAAAIETFSLHALLIDGARITVERWSWNAHSRRFELVSTTHPPIRGQNP